jgi:hypothetical protein
MRRIAIAAVAATAFLVSACGGDDDAKFKKKTLTFTERDTDEFGFVDAAPKTKLTRDGPKKLSNADQLTFSSDLFDASKKDVGDLDASCIAIRATRRFETSSMLCTGVMTIPGGSLTLSVGGKPFQEGVDTRGAVVGGSEEYAGATGSFTSTESGRNRPSKDTITVFVPKE